MTNQTPSIGQSVHYVGYGPDGAIPPYTCLAATVTALHEEACGDGVCLSVRVVSKADLVLFFKDHVCHANGQKSLQFGTWHWPERTGS